METVIQKPFSINALVRSNIAKLKPYSCARDEFKGNASVYIDANENALGSPLTKDYSRYPDAYQHIVKKKISRLKNVSVENIFLGNGSDEAIDLLMRVFCEPSKDNIIITPPTYGMYKVQADINNVEVKEVLLNADFGFPVRQVIDAADNNTKMVFICSPNNPTGQLVSFDSIEKILNAFPGLVIVDEAYIDFNGCGSTLPLLQAYDKLVVLQTFSKAWGLAGLRAGMAFGSKAVIELLNTIKYPYNVSGYTQAMLLEALDNKHIVDKMVMEINKQKEFLEKEFAKFSFIKKVYPSAANFLLIKVDSANALYVHLSKEGIVVRNRSQQPLCENCLRITIGNIQENIMLLKSMSNYEKQ
jgi:histidinol-phosphate aminotransferase